MPVDGRGEVGGLAAAEVREGRGALRERVVPERGRDGIAPFGRHGEGVVALRVGRGRARLRARERDGDARQAAAARGDAPADGVVEERPREVNRLVGAEVARGDAAGAEGVVRLRGRDGVVAAGREVRQGEVPLGVRGRVDRQRARERDGHARESGVVLVHDAPAELVPVERPFEVDRLRRGRVVDGQRRRRERVVPERGRDGVAALGRDVEGVVALRVGRGRARLRARERDGDAGERRAARGGGAPRERDVRGRDGEVGRLVCAEVCETPRRGGRVVAGP